MITLYITFHRHKLALRSQCCIIYFPHSHPQTNSTPSVSVKLTSHAIFLNVLLAYLVSHLTFKFLIHVVPCDITSFLTRFDGICLSTLPIQGASEAGESRIGHQLATLEWDLVSKQTSSPLLYFIAFMAEHTHCIKHVRCLHPFGLVCTLCLL